MYFKNTCTGELFQSEDSNHPDSIEISEEEFLSAASEIAIQPDGIENSGGNITGENEAGTKTMELNAADGSAMFAAGAVTIGATGMIMSKSEIRCANPDGSIGITSLDQASWIVKLTKSSLAYTGGNVYTSTGRPSFNGSTGATIEDLKSYQPKLPYTPVQQGTGIGQQTSNVVKIGWGDNEPAHTGRVRITIDSTDQGNVVFDDTLNSGHLSAQFTRTLSLVGSGAIGVAGTGDTNGYGIVVSTPKGIYAPNGTSNLGDVHLANVATAEKGIIYPNIPNCATHFSMGFGWDGAHVRYLVDNNPAASNLLASMTDLAANGGGIVASGSGWVRFANGLIMQYSVGSTIQITTDNQVVNFPIAFKNGLTYSITITPYNSISNIVAYNNASAVGGSFSVRTNQPGNTSITYIAIGY